MKKMENLDWTIKLQGLLKGITDRYIDPSSEIADTATIRGLVYIGKNVFIADDVLVVGPCYIGDGCFVGAKNIIQRSYLTENVNLGTRSYISDSLLERNVWVSNVGTSNVKLTMDFTDKAGVYIKEGAKLGMGVIVMPGITIGSNCVVYPSAIINKNVPDNSTVKVKIQTRIIVHGKNSSDTSSAS